MISSPPPSSRPTSSIDEPTNQWKEFGFFMLDVLYNVVIIIALVVLIRTFLVSPFKVVGSSMADTLHNNEYILIDRLSYRVSDPKRGDPIVFLPPITNKDAAKFDELAWAGEDGTIELDTSELRTIKIAIYCKPQFLQKFWFCEEGVNEGDLVYFQPVNSEGYLAGSNLPWSDYQKATVSLYEADTELVTLDGVAGQSYAVRIYSPHGPDYFVKRIIGLPGDTIRIENGRVYLRSATSPDFVELSETYLNNENEFNTFYKRLPNTRDILVPEGHYFVMGDNRGHSNDSRHWFSPIDETYSPFLDRDSISGKVLIVLWPFGDLRLLDSAVLDDLEAQDS